MRRVSVVDRSQVSDALGKNPNRKFQRFRVFRSLVGVKGIISGISNMKNTVGGSGISIEAVRSTYTNKIRKFIPNPQHDRGNQRRMRVSAVTDVFCSTATTLTALLVRDLGAFA